MELAARRTKVRRTGGGGVEREEAERSVPPEETVVSQSFSR